MKFDYNLKNYDLKLVVFMVILNAFGIAIMRSATGAATYQDPQVVRQIMGSLAGLAICIALSLVNYRWVLQQSGLIYLISVMVLLGVLVYGTASGHGAVRWIQLPILGQVQPAEFVKIGLIIFYANYFQKVKDDINNKSLILYDTLFLKIMI